MVNNRYHVNHTTKIAKIADQAHEESNVIYHERLKTERADNVIFFDIFNQRFAELIIKECIAVCDSGTATQTTCFGAGEMIKQHFGVENG